MNQGEHPYDAFGDPGYGSDARYTTTSIDGFGYGDPGYGNLGYDGPASEDTGVPGTRTVRGFVEPGRADAGYLQHSGQGYRDSGYMEPGDYQAPGVYREPWDYDQPLRYSDEEPAYPADRAPAYDPADYNGSAYSRPGIDGPGYDLSGIIGTDEFEASGYDEPRFDETRLDSMWLSGGEDFPSQDGRGQRSHRGRGLDETRMDLAADARAWPQTQMDLAADANAWPQTQMDLPVYDETRVEDLRALGPAAADLRPAAASTLAPPQDWAEQTSLDAFDVLDLDEDMPRAGAPPAFARLGLDENHAPPRRAAGRRRGRSSDRKQWMALGAIAIVAAGVIGGVVYKFGQNGPAHTISTPNQAGQFTRMPNLEKQMNVGQMVQETAKTSKASDVVGAVYQEGKSVPGSPPPPMFMFVGGLENASPSKSQASFIQAHPGAKAGSGGVLGGDAACAELTANGGQAESMCVWWDNDTFGDLESVTMTPSSLATAMAEVRPDLERDVGSK
jgi:hypothetical protein